MDIHAWVDNKQAIYVYTFAIIAQPYMYIGKLIHMSEYTLYVYLGVGCVSTLSRQSVGI